MCEIIDRRRARVSGKKFAERSRINSVWIDESVTCTYIYNDVYIFLR